MVHHEDWCYFLGTTGSRRTDYEETGTSFSGLQDLIVRDYMRRLVLVSRDYRISSYVTMRRLVLVSRDYRISSYVTIRRLVLVS